MTKGLRFDLLAKGGYTARGVVFLLIAGLALFSGVAGGRPETKSALSTLLAQPFGRVWVGIIGLGLLGFVAWRLAQSLADSDGHGKDAKALVIRAALLGSAITYLGLAGYALGRALFFGGGSEGSGEKGFAGWIMSQPFGSYLAIAVGAGFVIGGIVTVAKGISRKFERYVKIPDSKGIVTWICVYGLVARGMVFAITGVLFAYAGWIRNRPAAWATPWNGSASFRLEPSSTSPLPLDWQPSDYTILSRHDTASFRAHPWQRPSVQFRCLAHDAAFRRLTRT